ncbi:hypothetical protein SRB17_82320 [Streptomyces sp. RB17]|nr:hypothetical protein [Streptomyces sp. RB17]
MGIGPILRTVSRFCHTADQAITHRHVPKLRGLEGKDLHRELAGHIVRIAHKAWTVLQNPDDGCVRFEHDHYLKIWALTQPKLDADYLLLNEAQDTDPSSRRSSSPNATTPNSSWSATPPRPSATGAAPQTS